MSDMRLLFDQNISFRITHLLPDNFTDCRHVSSVGLIDCDDEIIWRYAGENDFTIVTFDADFSKISRKKGAPPKIIWLRTGNLTTSEIAELLILNFSDIYTFINNPDQNRLEIF